MAVTPSIRFPPGPPRPQPSPGAGGSMAGGRRRTGDLRVQDRGPPAPPTAAASKRYCAVKQHLPSRGSLLGCRPALPGVTTPPALSYLSPCKSWVCTPGNFCFGLTGASSSSSSSSSLQVAGARPDFCSCDGAEAGEGKMGSAAADCTRTHISALWKRVPEVGSAREV